MEQKGIQIKLSLETLEKIDELVKQRVFASRSEAVKFGVKLILLMKGMELPLSQRAEDYAYEEIKEKLERIRNVHRS